MGWQIGLRGNGEGKNIIILSVVNVGVVYYGKDTTHTLFITCKVKSQVRSLSLSRSLSRARTSGVTDHMFFIIHTEIEALSPHTSNLNLSGPVTFTQAMNLLA